MTVQSSSNRQRHPIDHPAPDALAPTLRRPDLADGPALHDLIARCPPLDMNSRYCNLLQVTHFAGTSILAEDEKGLLVGAVTGYVPPAAPDTLFVWQVAVVAAARGRRLAPRMLEALLERPACRSVRWLETSITPGNGASWATFAAFARMRSAEIHQRPWFLRDPHFAGEHDDEALLRIGPLRPPSAQYLQETV
jgi:L-2,4-diaminobutyric acid acetyltransferase